MCDTSEVITFVKKFADLVCVEFRHVDSQYWEVFSNKFRFSPSENAEDGFFPVRAIIDSKGHVKLKVLSFIAREADWMTQRADAEVIIRSLSYYGHRHKFCPGIFIAEEYSCLEGDHLKSSKKITFSQYPYEHYRSSQCSYYYSSFKSSITKVVTSAKCPNCRKFYSNRKAASKRPHLSLTNQPSEKVKHISNEEIIFLEEKNGDYEHTAKVDLRGKRRSNRTR
uniref:Uncharacterized protein n=1 Tax=Daphnia galeata TaxID=27404 RepID=A0A8J2S236_9CRUS|nr:unnamed protein product [Daphnia galeata]